MSHLPSWLTKFCAVLFVGILSMWLIAAEPPTPEARSKATQLLQEGNFREAAQQFSALVFDPKADPAHVASDLQNAVQALINLGQLNQVDDLLEKAISQHGTNWRLLKQAANLYMDIDHNGFMVAGKFQRGGRPGRGRRGQWVNSRQRDRVRALQLLEKARLMLKDESDNVQIAEFYVAAARILFWGPGHHEAWRLQGKTDLDALPEYEEGTFYFGGQTRGAPVDIDGNPVYHRLPESFDEATTDGEQWRYLLSQVVEFDPSRRDEIEFQFAQFCQSQFGVQTIAGGGPLDFEPPTSEDHPQSSGTYALHTLSDDETIARLATGIKRFSLPDEFNYVKLFLTIADRTKQNKNHWTESARATLCQEFEDRRQYPKAVEQWQIAIRDYGPGVNNDRQKRLEQIVNHWGRFESDTVKPAGVGATLKFRFRNAKHVSFDAREIKVADMLKKVKDYLKSNPKELDWQKLNVQDVGYRIVIENQQALLGRQVAQWELDLKPLPNHVDDQIIVTTPLQKAGAYLVTAKVEGGNTSQIVVWVTDTVIAKKQLNQKAWYFIADAVTGLPIEKANVEFFGWQQVQVAPNRQQFQVKVSQTAYFSDANGQIQLDQKKLPQEMQWLIIATTPQGRLAHMGFTNVWYGAEHDPEYNAVKVLAITDRPVYRPGQTVKYKFWVQQAKYDLPDVSTMARKKFRVELYDGKGVKIHDQESTTDDFGGFDSEYTVPAGATLGNYTLQLFQGKNGLGGGSFRVEEYKKPEYEVRVEAPTKPVQLGEKITAQIQAKYYFGAPVTKARVKYKVMRSVASSDWHPVAPWDWFYGRGYWWFTPEYSWYPGWKRWGCSGPAPHWFPRGMSPPEMVADVEAVIGEDGSLAVEIDTLPAKELHGNQDHQYSITAEVIDESRRTIVGTGNVLVARDPFRVFAWLDHGYYTTGDTILAQFHVQTLDGRPVSGKGKLDLYRIQYDSNQKPVETVVQTWDVDIDSQGDVRQQIAASEPGQYRLELRANDDQGHTQEGATLFVVRGAKFDGREFRFNDLELITDKREYAAGDKVRLMINTNRSDGAVLLFLRPTNGVYLPPTLIRLKGKSTVQEIAVVNRDMPNFFIEAMCIANGRLFTEMREVVVPPEKRVLNVEVMPDATRYLPGAPAKLRLKLTDSQGKPFVGSTVISVYDKSLEYISGGGNVPEIREFFWKYRRYHHPVTESTLQSLFGNLIRPNDTPMSNLGVFGEILPVDLAGGTAAAFGVAEGLRGGGGGGADDTVMSAPPISSRSLRSAAPMAGALSKQMAEETLSITLAEEPGGKDRQTSPTIRSEFADLAFWAGSVTTAVDGTAEVEFKMPENLTGWKARCWAMGTGTRVGQGEAEIVTKKNVIVRLQAPRFFVQKDEVVLSANVRNDLTVAKQFKMSLELDGDTLDPLGSTTSTVEIAAGAELRVDWRVKVVREGEATVRMLAVTDVESDAMQMKFPVYVHGMLKLDSFSGVVRPDADSAQLKFKVPEERRISDSRLVVRYSPTLAGAMVDALPYLVEYPYGCTEQTLNRFVPTVVTQRILQKMGVDLKAVGEHRNNLNTQELGDPAERAKGWKRFERNPVFDASEVTEMSQAGVKALTEMQLSDGGWGWFSGFGEHSWPHTTAVVVHGLQLARQNDVAIVPDVLERGIAWLKNYQAQQVTLIKEFANKDSKNPKKQFADELDALIYMILSDADVVDAEMREFLYRDRQHLAVYAKALFGLALHQQREEQKLAMILQNIDQFLVQDEENQTAYLELPAESSWWYWYGSQIEANAWYLKLLSRTDPKAPKTAGLAKYLLNNRKHATYWSSTRDTAYAIEALAEFLKGSGEAEPNQTIEIWLDGKPIKEVTVDPKSLFTFDNQLELVGDAVSSGEHILEVRRKGKGPVYFNAYLTNFSMEDSIQRAGLEVRVNRKIYKLTPKKKEVAVAGARGQFATQKVEKYERTELDELATVKSGDLIEVELEIDSKNDYEYLLFEDYKAAGFEAVAIRSGYGGNGLGAYMEMRDNRVAFFIRALARGKHSVSYRLRAEIPGNFSALPARASAMYAPELQGNSDEIRLQIAD